LNPMYYFIRLYRIPLYYGRLPNWQELLPVALIAGVTLIAGWLIFTRKSDEFAYRL
jgi:ABC-type polysaccharide/polyol phosphate export permease